MNTTTPPPRPHAHAHVQAHALQALGRLILTAMLAACGGNSDGPAASSRETAATLAATGPTLVQGCVVDERHALRPGRSVRVLDAAGAVLGEAVSDAQGEFELVVPGGQWLTVLVLPEGRDLLQARADGDQLWLSSCLQDRTP